MKLPMTPQKTQSRWAAEVAHVARLALAGQGIRHIDMIELSLSGMCALREGLRACNEGRLRLAVLCFVAAYAGDVFVAARHTAYIALPASPSQALKFTSGRMTLHARATACREAGEKYQSGPEVVA
jgi:hypothetical protein